MSIDTLINTEQMTKTIKKELKHRGTSLTDEQIENLINEIDFIYDQTKCFIPDLNIQRLAPAFVSGVLFALDNCVNRKEDWLVTNSTGYDGETEILISRIENEVPLGQK